MIPEWYRSLAHIESLGYMSRCSVDPRSLPCFGMEPKSVDGKTLVPFEWNTPAKHSSPARTHYHNHRVGKDFLERAWESFELPGEAADYLIAIDGTLDRLAALSENSKAKKVQKFLKNLRTRLVSTVETQSSHHLFYSARNRVNECLREGWLEEAVSSAAVGTAYLRFPRAIPCP